jgi:hypothetical protein
MSTFGTRDLSGVQLRFWSRGRRVQARISGRDSVTLTGRQEEIRL